MARFRHFIHFIINCHFLRPQTFSIRNLDLPGNIAAVDKRKIYMFRLGNQRQNMSTLPVSSSNNRMTAPGRKLHACRSWASQGSADLPKIGLASNNNIAHRSLSMCVHIEKERRKRNSKGWQPFLPLIISVYFPCYKILNPLMPSLIAKTINKSQADPQ